MATGAGRRTPRRAGIRAKLLTVAFVLAVLVSAVQSAGDVDRGTSSDGDAVATRSASPAPGSPEAPVGPTGEGREDRHGDMPMVPVPPEAEVATAPRLDVLDWSVTSSTPADEAVGRVADVLDGSAATGWRSRLAQGNPTTVTIDTGAPRVVSGLLYRPATGGGALGRFEVRLSTDGTDFGDPVATGTWADDPAEKTAAFAPRTARYVRLTALAGADGRAAWTSVGELGLLGAPADTGPDTGADEGAEQADVPLPRDDWVATASDAETAAETADASRVLDGDPRTYWHSAWSQGAVGLPHSVTLTLPGPTTVSGLRYLPRQGEPNGHVGDYRVEVSRDGRSFTTAATGTFADSYAAQTVTFDPTEVTRVRLVATSEAGGRGAWSSVAELDLLGSPAEGSPGGGSGGSDVAAGRGSWGPVTGLPLVPSSAALLPGNRLLVWSGASGTSYGMDSGVTQAAVVDLGTGRVGRRTVVDTDHEMFCTGIARLADGRILISGGSDAGRTTLYDPANDSWSPGPPLNVPRGYQSDVTLSTGQVLTLGGSWSGGFGGKDGEIWTPGGSWRRLSGVTARRITTGDAGGLYRSDNHAWLFAVGGGGVFHAGPSTAMTWINTTGDGSMRTAGARYGDGDAMNGNAVMYDVGRIMTNGGSPSYDDSDATRLAFTIDVSRGPRARPVVARTGSMAAARAFQNSVVLPDGTVLVVGGQARAKPFTDTTAAMYPELWDPATGRFSTMERMAVPRTYHSVALLLPDGRVWSGGGGLCGDCATNHPDGQVFTPPYLLRADGEGLRVRPGITDAPTRVRPGAVMRVRTTRQARSFALVRMGTATHTVNTDQRRIPLRAGPRRRGGYALQVPASRGTVVPGDYLLFAMGMNGAPSVARTVNIR